MLYQPVFSSAVASSFLTEYLLSLGEFDTENYAQDGADDVVWVVFMMSTFFSQIVFLNMLIAIMGDTFGRVTEVREQSGRAETIQILADFVDVVPRESEASRTLFRYVFSIEPNELAQGEASPLEGPLAQLKQNAEENVALVKEHLSKQVALVNSEVNSKIAGLEERMNDLRTQSDEHGELLRQLVSTLVPSNGPTNDDVFIEPAYGGDPRHGNTERFISERFQSMGQYSENVSVADH